MLQKWKPETEYVRTIERKEEDGMETFNWSLR